MLREKTSRRAFELWQSADRPEGRVLEFWLRAEQPGTCWGSCGAGVVHDVQERRSAADVANCAADAAIEAQARGRLESAVPFPADSWSAQSLPLANAQGMNRDNGGGAQQQPMQHSQSPASERGSMDKEQGP